MGIDATTGAVMAIIFAAALVRGLTGFGNALIAMPLLALVIPILTATPVVAATALLMGLVLLYQHRTDVDFRSAAWLVVFAGMGTPIGLLLLRGVNEGVVQLILAATIAGFSIFSLAKPPAGHMRGGISTVIAGLFAGVLGGAYNTNGPPVVIYGTLRGWDPDRFKGTLQGFFIPANIIIVIYHALGGLWTAEVVRLSLYSLVPMAAGILLAMWLSPRIPAKRFTWLVHGLLLICAGLLVYRGIGSLITQPSGPS